MSHIISKTYKQLIQLNNKKKKKKEKRKKAQLKVNRRPKQAFLQRRHTHGQQAYEKIFKITNY